MATTVVSPTPEILSYTLKRDSISRIGGKPHRRILVYEIDVRLPVGTSGVQFFEVEEGFTITSLRALSSSAFRADADYIIQNIRKAKTVGVLEIRGGKTKNHAIILPNIGEALAGPCRISMLHREGSQPAAGNILFEVVVSGPPPTVDAIVDENGDGVPDDLAEGVIPGPGFILPENYDSFLVGYNKGIKGENL